MTPPPPAPFNRITTVCVRPGPAQRRQAASGQAARLVEEMIAVWRRGGRVRTEELLARHPELWNHPEAVAELIYEEVCLHQEFGQPLPVEEVLARFPQWRSQLAVLLGCQQLLAPKESAPCFPHAGERLGDFQLLAVLGRGGQGYVFLANQVSLGERPVVLKLTPCAGQEHLSLARLQHTHIVPLYSAQDYPARGLRALCMPYFGGAALDQLLAALQPVPPGQRTGRSLHDALARTQPPALVPVAHPVRPTQPPPSYVHAVCHLGICLAEALQYAHDRGLVHLDLKPANVLLTADGQPMLLDFHVSRAPLTPDGPTPTCIGGTPAYMSPEQRAALSAAQHGQPISRRVDGRSDLYSLGVVLFESLSGTLPEPADPSGSLRRANPLVSIGLADVIAHCLHPDPERRYPTLAALADDLRRHGADQPLRGVRNRSLTERWRKWRRRRPHGLASAGMLLAVLLATAAVAIGAVSHFVHRTEQARIALKAGRAQLARGQHAEALTTFQVGAALVQSVPFQDTLRQELNDQAHLAGKARAEAEGARVVRELHALAERIRSLRGVKSPNEEEARRLDACCRALWEQRCRILAWTGAARQPALERRVRDDLLDVAMLWADLLERLAAPADQGQARQTALAILEQAGELCGPGPVLDEARRRRTEP